MDNTIKTLTRKDILVPTTFLLIGTLLLMFSLGLTNQIDPISKANSFPIFRVLYPVILLLGLVFAFVLSDKAIFVAENKDRRDVFFNSIYRAEYSVFISSLVSFSEFIPWLELKILAGIILAAIGLLIRKVSYFGSDSKYLESQVYKSMYFRDLIEDKEFARFSKIFYFLGFVVLITSLTQKYLLEFKINIPIAIPEILFMFSIGLLAGSLFIKINQTNKNRPFCDVE